MNNDRRLGSLCEEYVELTLKVRALEARRDAIFDVLCGELPPNYHAHVLCGSGMTQSILYLHNGEGTCTVDVLDAVASYALDWPVGREDDADAETVSVADIDEEAA